jgi:hypothetical protein
MGLIRFAQRVLGIRVDTPSTAPMDPVAQAYADALLLIDAMFHGDPWSRRAWDRRMGERRWELATDLLRSMDIVDRKGRCLLPMGYSQLDAEVLVREAANRQRERQRHRNWVAPR